MERTMRSSWPHTKDEPMLQFCPRSIDLSTPDGYYVHGRIDDALICRTDVYVVGPMKHSPSQIMEELKICGGRGFNRDYEIESIEVIPAANSELEKATMLRGLFCITFIDKELAK